VVVKIADEKKYVLFFPDNCGEKKTFEIINKTRRRSILGLDTSGRKIDNNSLQSI
jgi:hypothetical protein